MFILNTDRVVKWPVVVEVPIDGGAVQAQQFEMSFKLVAMDDLATFNSFEDVIVGWDGVFAPAEEGEPQPLPFSGENLGRMLAVPYARRAIGAAYIACQTGARRKNSVTPLPGGQAATTPAPATTK